jgi:SAM-dependent methyltransferase
MFSIKQEHDLAKLIEGNEEHYMVKFCTCPHSWFKAAMDIAQGLRLHESPSLQILDIGCGFGYFLLVAKRLGHSAAGIDLNDPIVNTAAAILGADVTPCQVHPFTVLPYEFCGYHLITTFGVNFRNDDNTYWDHEAYAFLTRDLLERLKPGGRWVLRPNVKDYHARDHGEAFVFNVDLWTAAICKFADVQIDGWQITVIRKERAWKHYDSKQPKS